MNSRLSLVKRQVEKLKLGYVLYWYNARVQLTEFHS